MTRIAICLVVLAVLPAGAAWPATGHDRARQPAAADATPAAGPSRDASAPPPQGVDVMRQWDAVRYYNADLGLKDFVAEVTCPLYASVVQTRIGRPPVFKLYWRWPGDYVVKVDGIEDQAPVREVIASIEAQLPYLIPKSVADTVGHYKIGIGLDRAGQGVLQGDALSPTWPVRMFTMTFDKQGREVSMNWLTMGASNVTRTVTASQTQDGRQLVTDATLKTKRTTGAISEAALHWDYIQVNKIWLPAMMTVNDRNQAPVSFFFSKHQVNRGLPKEIATEIDGKAKGS